jgi:hypothetical protein
MKPSSRLLATAVVTALFSTSPGCGHRGDPLPPRRRTPPGLAEFHLAQRGKSLEVSLLTPAASVDGVPYETIVVEILYAEGAKDLEKAGERRELLAQPQKRVTEKLPLPAPGTVARVAARGIAGKNKGTRTLTLALVAQDEVAPPRELRARLVAGGVRLAWDGEPPKPVSALVLPPRPPGLPGVPRSLGPRPVPPEPAAVAPPPAQAQPQPAAPATPAPQAAPAAAEKLEAPGSEPTREPTLAAGFFVYRRIGTASYRMPLSQEPLAELRVTDSSPPLGATACYVVRAAASVDPLVESEASNEACVEVRDIEPPAAPSGLAVLPRERGLEVLWAPSREEDIAGYRIYRQAPGEARSRIGEVEAGRAAWLDESAQPGTVYQYEVTAFDGAGNESPPTKAVEASR